MLNRLFGHDVRKAPWSFDDTGISQQKTGNAGTIITGTEVTVQHRFHRWLFEQDGSLAVIARIYSFFVPKRYNTMLGPDFTLFISQS